MEPQDTDFTGKVPTFSEFIGENYPAGAANDPNAPWNRKEPETWAVTGVTYDEKNGDIVFDIDGSGYPDEVRIWAGDNVIIDEIDPKLDLDEDEADVKLHELISKMNSDQDEIPAKIMDHTADELADKYDEYWAEDAAAEARFERMRDDDI